MCVHASVERGGGGGGTSCTADDKGRLQEGASTPPNPHACHRRGLTALSQSPGPHASHPGLPPFPKTHINCPPVPWSSAWHTVVHTHVPPPHTHTDMHHRGRALNPAAVSLDPPITHPNPSPSPAPTPNPHPDHHHLNLPPGSSACAPLRPAPPPPPAHPMHARTHRHAHGHDHNHDRHIRAQSGATRP